MFSAAALEVLRKRYLLKDPFGRVVETPEKMFRRVALEVAGKNRELAQRFEKLMADLRFLPNSPTLMNAGTELGQLSACFVLPIEDSLASIFESLKNMALIEQSGGGTGFSFSGLRPKNDAARTTQGVASGPLSFLNIFNAATEVVKQGGRRRGANMGVLSVNHPDILGFIRAKENEKALSNFIISVAVTDEFMRAAIKKHSYPLLHPRTGKITGKLNAAEVLDKIAEMAWKTGDPGLLFVDEINRKNPLLKLGRGELPLLPYESSNLGSINLTKMLYAGQIDWEKLGDTVDLAVEFLDNVIDANHYPLPEIEQMTKSNRKIGLGVMGFADALLQMELRYNSDPALFFAERLMRFITERARKRSEQLAQKKGSFPNLKKSKLNYKKMRNATVTSISPTGSLSLIADCSFGIEPLFAASFSKKALGGARLSNQATALGIKPEWHVKMQAAFQKFTDNAVSKTVSLPPAATPEEIKEIFLLAHELKCKGITVYRYGSKSEQVFYLEDSGAQCCNL